MDDHQFTNRSTLNLKQVLLGLQSVLSRGSLAIENLEIFASFNESGNSPLTINWLIQFAESLKHKWYFYFYCYWKMKDFSSLISFMAFLTSTNGTCWKENLVAFPKFVFNLFNTRVVKELQEDAINDIKIIS